MGGAWDPCAAPCGLARTVARVLVPASPPLLPAGAIWGRHAGGGRPAGRGGSPPPARGPTSDAPFLASDIILASPYARSHERWRAFGCWPAHFITGWGWDLGRHAGGRPAGGGAGAPTRGPTSDGPYWASDIILASPYAGSHGRWRAFGCRPAPLFTGGGDLGRCRGLWPAGRGGSPPHPRPHLWR